MSQDDKSGGVTGDHQNRHYYGTFQGVANYYPPPPSAPQPPSQPVIGFPQPVPPFASTADPRFYPQIYQTLPVYAVVEGTPVRERRLPCCGIGFGWFLFVIGFFLGGIPWYIGTFLLLCGRLDHLEKPGYIACAIASFLAVIAVTLGATRGAHHW